MKKPILITIITTLLFIGCAKDYDIKLDRSIFVEDPIYTSLPIYSELGYNTFGAYIDRVPFRSSNAILPNKIIVQDGILSLEMTGEMQTIDHSYERASITFRLGNSNPKTYQELSILANQTIDLKNSEVAVSLTMNNKTLPLKIIEGKLIFKKARELIVDDEPLKMVLSGTFNFKTFRDGSPITIKNGRFDLGFGYDNFYNLD